VTMKIEASSDGQTVMLRLIGRIESLYIEELQAEVRRHPLPLVLDLDQVTLVDQQAVRFFVACEAEGIELVHCAPYIREWMSRDRGREPE
jgi:anti-anti-sigma regulatory factor